MAKETQNLTIGQILDGEVAERVRRLEIFSRLRVEGSRAGDNRSPFRGFSTDYLQHRQYSQGDSLRFLDWRVLAKTDRLYVKQFEQHTNAEMVVAVDVSGSMRFRGQEAFSKYEFAVRTAAILFYLMNLQRDTSSLFLFSESLTTRVPRGSSRQHLQRVLATLAMAEPAGGTRFELCFRLLESMLSRRGLIVVLSDFMDEPDTVAKALGRFRMQRHDVIALQIVAPSEERLPFVDFTRFRDLEDASVVGLDPLLVSREYERQFAEHGRLLREACLTQRVDHATLPVCDEYDVPVGEYLRRRQALLE